jgi:hypothetical protein
MSDPDDRWPLPHYSAGPRDHLHAFGVISTMFNGLEDTMFALFRHHLDALKVSFNLSEFFWLSLNERQRPEALKMVFANCEKDNEVTSRVVNLIAYFEWCWTVRNMLSHAQHYPAMLGGKPDIWHLMKRISKRNPNIGYAQFDLATLRSMADRIRVGTQQCLRVVIYLRVRDFPGSRQMYRAYANAPLPEILQVPESPQLSETPDSSPKPQPQPTPSRPKS